MIKKEVDVVCLKYESVPVKRAIGKVSVHGHDLFVGNEAVSAVVCVTVT